MTDKKEAAKTKGLDDNFRRKWDKTKYLEKTEVKSAVVKNEFNKDEVAKKEKLTARNFLLNLEKKVGKTMLVKKTVDPKSEGGFYCDICECAIKDSINFLDHINGRQHQKNLGMSMNVERSSLDQVKERIQKVKQAQEEKKLAKKPDDYNFIESAEKNKEILDTKKKQKDAKKRKYEQQQEQLSSFNDDDVTKLMGFGGFGTLGKK